MKSLLNSEISLTRLKLFTGNFYDIAQPDKLFKSQNLRWGDCLFLS